MEVSHRKYHVIELSPCGRLFAVADFSNIVIGRLNSDGTHKVYSIGGLSCGVRDISWCSSDPAALAVATDEDKHVTIWVLRGDEFVKAHSWPSPKRISCVTTKYTETSLDIVYATKFGEVWGTQLDAKCLLGGDDESAKALWIDPTMRLGHLSILTSLVFSNDDKYLLSADRDEKVRTSHWPAAYDIEEYCLGHTQFVSRIIEVVHPTTGVPLVLSGSGDGTLRLWNYVDGKQLDSVQCGAPTKGCDPHTVVPLSWCPKKLVAAVLIDSFLGIQLYSVQAREDSYKLVPRGVVGDGNVPIDGQFDLDGALWAIWTSGSPNDPLCAYVCDEAKSDGDRLCYVQCAKDSAAQRLCTAIDGVPLSAADRPIPQAFTQSLEWESMRKNHKSLQKQS